MARRDMTNPLPDAQARLAALDPRVSFIVQAPAGSGKTELLAQRFLGLLAVVDEPEQIVACTFTRKAAGEMLDRILRALERARDEAEPTEPHKAATWRLARAALARDTERKWDVLGNPSRLRVTTIDSLCAAIVRRLPVATGLGAQPAVEEDPSALHAAAASRTLAALDRGGPEGAAVERLLLHLDNNFTTVSGLLVAMLGARDQWMRHLPGTGDRAKHRQLLEKSLAALPANGAGTRAGRRLRRSCEPKRSRSAGSPRGQLAADTAIAPLAAMRSFPAAEPADYDAWTVVCALVCTKSGAIRARRGITRACGFPVAADGRNEAERQQFGDMKQRMQALVEALAGSETAPAALAAVADLPPAGYDPGQWEILEALFDLLPLAERELQKVFAREGKVDFIEIATRARRALDAGGAELTDEIRHLLVDEFQDTSYSQYGLVERLTAGWDAKPGRTVFVVGDPMQSIYRFREAEVGLFIQAVHTRRLGCVALEPVVLARNFRSLPGIVEWVNEKMGAVLPPPGKEDVLTGAVSYSESQATRPDAGAQCVHIHPFFDMGDGAHAGAEAQAVARIAKDSLVRRAKVKASGTTAILVRARTHLPEIIDALKSAKLPFQAVEIDRLGERPAVQDLLALTRALVHLADRIAWLAVLRAPWCGLTLEDLLRVAQPGGEQKPPKPDPDDDAPAPPVLTVYEALADAGVLAAMSSDGRARAERVSAVLAAALEQRGRTTLRRVVEGAWLALGAPACLANATELEEAEEYLDLLEELEEGGDLPDLVALGMRVTDLFAPADVNADGSLQVLTMHKAKGLEFDTVILPGLGRKPRGDEKRLLRWAELASDDATGRHLLLAPVERTGYDPDRVTRFLKSIQTAKGEFETGRLLYVATTRARDELHLLGVVKPKLDDDGAVEKMEPVKNSLLYYLWDGIGGEWEKAFVPAKTGGGKDDADRDEEAEDAFATAARPIRRVPSGWAPPPPPAGVAARAGGNDAGDEDDGKREEWTGALHHADAAIRHAGTVVHRYLCRIGRDGAAAWDAARIEASRGAFAAMLRQLAFRRVKAWIAPSTASWPRLPPR